MPAADHRLTTAEMAQFVAEGHLRFAALVPADVNEAVLAALPDLEQAKIGAALAMFSGADALPHPDQAASLTPLAACYPDPAPLGRFLRLPAVQGIIESLVGPDPVFDHDFVHHLAAGHGDAQHLHADAVADTTDPTFDIQLFYFPHEVGPDGGGTRFVPGTHVRRAPSSTIAAYHHVRGDEFFAGPAGTVMVFHHALWHAGQPNPGDADRWMYKIRLNPTQPQVKRWNLDDFDAVHNDPADHVFARSRSDSVAAILRRPARWEGTDDSRYDLMERARLWRYVSGDDTFDADYYLTRHEQRSDLAT
ncbi:MAG: phytanoyl-CoA dioxygenase family protein [Actinomycetota bacterium]